MKAPSGVAPEVLSLPKGGGAVRSIGDTFSPDLYSGSGSYQVPLWFPKGPGGFQPGMSLIYTSGSGNGAFGMGWKLPLLEIRRRSDRGIPTYDDAKDTFLLDGQEIVPVGGDLYRLHIEGEFRRAVRTGAGWVVTDRGGRRFVLGSNGAARIEETKDGVTRTSAWLIETATDRNGNQVRYSYVRDQGQLYLDAITYGPYEIKFLYEVRPDLVTDRRAGFAVTTGLRSKGIEYRLPAEGAPLFRSYALSYEECPFSKLSLLSSVVFHGYSGPPGSPPDTSLPKLQFGYTPFTPKHAFKPISVPFGGPSSQLARATRVRPGRHARRRSSRGHPSGRLCAALLAEFGVGSGDRRARSGICLLILTWQTEAPRSQTWTATVRPISYYWRIRRSGT